MLRFSQRDGHFKNISGFTGLESISHNPKTTARQKSPDGVRSVTKGQGWSTVPMFLDRGLKLKDKLKLNTKNVLNN